MRWWRRCGAPPRSASAPTASRCCATPTATASPRRATPISTASTSRSAWRWSATPSMSATPTASSPFPSSPARPSSPAPAASSPTFKPGGHWTRSLLATPDGAALYVGVGSLTNIADERLGGRGRPRGDPSLRHRLGRCEIFASGPAQSRRPRVRADDRRAVDRRQRARRARRRDAAGLSDERARRRVLRLALLLLGPHRRRPRAERIRRWSPRRSSRITRSAATPPRSACAGCRPARCPASATAWSSASTARGTAARLSGYRVVLRAVRERPAERAAARHPLRLPGAGRERHSYGRPVGVALGPDKSLLVADDVGDVDLARRRRLRPVALHDARRFAPSRPGAVEHELTALDGVTAARGALDAGAAARGRSRYSAAAPSSSRNITRPSATSSAAASPSRRWTGAARAARSGSLRDRRKGHIDDFSLYERDLVAFTRDVLTPHCPRPWIGLCHSMGGAIMLRVAHDEPLPVRPAGADRADDRALRPAPTRASRAGSPRRSTASGSAAPMRRRRRAAALQLRRRSTTTC